jgi:hypothetical protein
MNVVRPGRSDSNCSNARELTTFPPFGAQLAGDREKFGT